jgi:hypothetical protein
MVVDVYSIKAKNNTMWSIESLWFEVAIVSIIYALGNILMGQFEERTPKIRRVGKYILTLIVVCGISVLAGRTVAMIFLALFTIPLVYVHGYFLPKKKGINGWTGEPKSRYYEFRKWDKDIFEQELFGLPYHLGFHFEVPQYKNYLYLSNNRIQHRTRMPCE